MSDENPASQSYALLLIHFSSNREHAPALCIVARLKFEIRFPNFQGALGYLQRTATGSARMTTSPGPWGQDATDKGERGPPVATIALVLVLAGAFLVEIGFSNAGLHGGAGVLKPDLATLDRLGALDKRLVLDQGQWWRLLTAPLLHGGVEHILLNSFALLLISPRLEKLIGSGWYAADFAVSALAGGLLSLALNPMSLVSVGASGGIMGLFTSAVVASYHLPPGSGMRMGLQGDALRVLVPTLIPALLIPLSGGSQNGIDVAAHLGGALGGLAVGLVCMRGRRAPAGLG